MRNIDDVLNNIIEILKGKDGAIDIINRLKGIIQDSKFTAPESMYIRWNQAHETLVNFLLDEEYKLYIGKEYGIEIFAVFSNNSKEDIAKEISR